MTAHVCQVATPNVALPCPERESGGYRCEATGPHVVHGIGRHTVRHALAGNGYACSAISTSGHLVERSTTLAPAPAARLAGIPVNPVNFPDNNSEGRDR